jgi:hypothetical protein
MDFADVKPSLLNWLTNGLMAVTFITFFKLFFGAIMPIPGLSELFASI